MKAIVRDIYGSPDVLEFRDAERPSPKDNQLLLKMSAASVNPLDWHVLRGDPFLIRLMGFGILKPKQRIFGADMAGQVEAVGKDVTQFKVGDEVYGSGMGAFAEYACLTEKSAAHKPANVSFEQAAAVSVAGITALQALRDQGRLQSGQHILINGASGGVGTFAVQIAKAMGANVTGVCSSKNLELVRSIGADHVIDYTKEHFWSDGERFDLIVDTAAFQSIGKSLQALKKGGRYVVVGGTSSTPDVLWGFIFNPIFAKIKGKKVVSFIANLNQADLVFLNGLMESGKLTPVIERKYALSETAEAIRHVEQGHTRGKVIINI